MRAISLIVFVFCNLQFCFSQDSIGLDALVDHVKFLASDELEGRGIGTKGGQLAANYIATQFQVMGLEKPPQLKDYFQSFYMAEKVRKENSIKIDSFEYKEKINDIFFENRFGAKGMSSYNALVIDALDKVGLAKDKIVYVQLPVYGTEKELFENLRALLNKVYITQAKGIIYLHPNIEQFTTSRLKLKNEEVRNGFIKFNGGKMPEFSIIHVNQAQRPMYIKTGATVNIQRTYNTRICNNVLGYLPGKLNPEKLIVYGGHFDHEGIKGKKVYNGADDNASGMAVLLEIARISQENPPDYSVLFIAFDAEEKGLVGSRFFVDEWNLAANPITFMLNADMIGRFRQEKRVININVVADKKTLNWAKKLAPPSIKLKVKLAKERNYYSRSDHYPFAQYGIPFISILGYEHKDYHQPTDTWDKLNYDEMKDVGELILQLLHEYNDN